MPEAINFVDGRRQKCCFFKNKNKLLFFEEKKITLSAGSQTAVTGYQTAVTVMQWQHCLAPKFKKEVESGVTF
jgi:hypothetical protein